MLDLLLAAESEEVTLIDRILQPSVLPFLVAIVAVIVGGTVAIVRSMAAHKERLAMIERGINPDEKDPPPES